MDPQTRLKLLYWIWFELDKIFRQPENKRTEMFANLFDNLDRKIKKANDELGSDAPTTEQLIEWLREMNTQVATPQK